MGAHLAISPVDKTGKRTVVRRHLHSSLFSLHYQSEMKFVDWNTAQSWAGLWVVSSVMGAPNAFVFARLSLTSFAILDQPPGLQPQHPAPRGLPPPGPASGSYHDAWPSSTPWW